MTAIICFTVTLIALSACKSGNSSSTANPPLPANFSGIWAGDSGPIPNALNFGSKIEIQEDAGVVSGEFFDEDPGKSGVFDKTGHVQGVRDGGTPISHAWDSN
jgi:hypothetical protein